ncbi:MAG: DUF262 domain-containing protein [Candidatus Limivicinus sp.]|nr:DUF262 domain-containing protein [Candidatus Limivicinus sp.]
MDNQVSQYQSLPGNMLYNNLIANIEQGQIKIPQFQRKFVWSIEETAGLIDSILKGYPIGTFIIWETNDRLRSIRNIGNFQFPDTPDGNTVQYVLDGQQRMTSLYVALRGAKLKDDNGQITDYSEIYVNLTAKSGDPLVLTDKTGYQDAQIIRFVDLLNGSLSLLLSKYKDYIDEIDAYRKAVQTYQFSKIDVKNAPIEVATEIFTRINIGGKPLTLFEIMAAKTYDEAKKFDLSEKYDTLVENLSNVDYDTISSSTVLQAVSVCLVKECTRKSILNLEKQKFIDIWPQVESAFESAVDYLRSFYKIPVSQLLPYDALLVPFTYYFFHHKDIPAGLQQDLLQDYFWRCVLTSRFSSAAETKLTQDVKQIDKILNDEQPVYDVPIDVSAEFIRNHGYFSAGSAFIKGMLCLLAYQQPVSFQNNGIVHIANDWLKQANSKNYHHFFPKAYMRKVHPEVEDWLVNHIGNITIVDDFLNKRSIRDRAPSKYISEYMAKNADLEKALNSHLISTVPGWGVLEDEYQTFFQNRLNWFSKELKGRVIVTQADRTA